MAKVTDRIDAYQPPHLDFPDPKVLGLIAQLNFTIARVQSQTIGPYAAIEGVISAIEDFAEDWNG